MRAVKIIIFIGLLLCIPIRSYAYFGKNEDYILSAEKPFDRAEGHFLEFAREETYKVEEGDTLWGIADACWGVGSYYPQIFLDNKDRVAAPDLLVPGMELKLRQTLYTRAGLKDYIKQEVFGNELLVVPEAFTMEDFVPPYRIFVSVPYVNDLQEADPYIHWEEFQKEVRASSEKICGNLVSDLSFERYQVTGIGPLCGYRFTFDAGDKDYVVMAYFCYNDTTKSEAFALCEKESCTERQLEEARGKAFYAAVRYLDPGVYYGKTEDYIGWEEWNYPQLRNPFADAMRSLYQGPLEQPAGDAGSPVIRWKEPVLEKLVREELAALWQLTPEEKQEFMGRDMRLEDLEGIEELHITYYAGSVTEREKLYVQMNGCRENGKWGAEIRKGDIGQAALLGTLEDLKNFRKLKKLELKLRNAAITDLSSLGELCCLRVLECNIYSTEARVENIDFLSNMADLRTLCLGGWSKGKFTKFFDGITDLSVLGSCPRLAYLTLVMGNVESWEFLRDLPEIYYADLDYKKRRNSIVPDESLLPGACFIYFGGEQIRFENGEGYGEK